MDLISYWCSGLLAHTIQVSSGGFVYPYQTGKVRLGTSVNYRGSSEDALISLADRPNYVTASWRTHMLKDGVFLPILNDDVGIIMTSRSTDKSLRRKYTLLSINEKAHPFWDTINLINSCWSHSRLNVYGGRCISKIWSRTPTTLSYTSPFLVIVYCIVWYCLLSPTLLVIVTTF